MIIEKIISDSDGLPLELAIIEPEGEARGIVQFLHGMAEHKQRYYDFMEYLAGHGYICAIHDHRGHGASVKDNSHLGYFYTEDMNAIVEDAHQIGQYLKDRYKDLGLSIFSHSMGTLVSRNYLKKYDDQNDKIVLCGPPVENSIVGVALTLAKILKPFYGKYKPNGILNSLAVEPFDKKFLGKNNWLSTDTTEVDKYNSDPLCGFVFTTNGFINTFKLLKGAFDSSDWDVKNPDLPILMIAGEDDPVIESVEKFDQLVDFVENLGYTDVESNLYENKRHELLNEVDKDLIYEDVLQFLNKAN